MNTDRIQYMIGSLYCMWMIAMIQDIFLKRVTSYDPENKTQLGPLGRINLIYGLNGSGKSTISRYLQDLHHQDYAHCQIVPVVSQDQVFVYNQSFIERNFYQKTQPGIFTLNEGNIEAEAAIRAAEELLLEIEDEQRENIVEKQSIERDRLVLDDKLKEELWRIKKLYDDSSLHYCFEGFHSNKGRFKDQLHITPLTSMIPRSGVELVAAAEELQSAEGTPLPEIPFIKWGVADIENDPVFSEVISASSDSYLSALIETLGNSDWVKNALPLLDKSHGKCPLCQQALPHDFLGQVKALFDKTYDEKIEKIESLKILYDKALSLLMTTLTESNFEQGGLSNNSHFVHAIAELERVASKNVEIIQKKISSPAIPVTLISTTELVVLINDLINEQRQINLEYNQRLLEKEQRLDRIKHELWQRMRQQGKSCIDEHTRKTSELADKQRANSAQALLLNERHKTTEASIVLHRSKVTNIDDSINKINSSLVSIGLRGFKIEKAATDMTGYRLVRPGHKVDVFRSLSEGEKTLIAFLYFIELCVGSVKSDTPVVLGNRIVVVDDPISSLSHNYVYEIASLMYHRLLSIKAGFKQVLVLTHNLFFFHELLKNGSPSEVGKYRCFRVFKREFSMLSRLQKDEIKNDYQAFWQVLKEAKQSNMCSAVLPNIMRNILEHYFAFIHKKDDLRKALDEMEGEDDGEFKPLYRYINRESHGDGINITDFGEIEPSRLLGKFKDVFVRTGYSEHYRVMIGEEITAEEPALIP